MIFLNNKIRLNKFLAEYAGVSRRKADELIELNKVFVNHKQVKINPFFVDPEKDLVQLDGVKINSNKNKKIYIAINKPLGYVCTMKDKYAKLILPDLYNYKIKERLFPVGRLDANTSGLILMTNDGIWANRISHPNKDVYKEYIATIDSCPKKQDLIKLRNGIFIDGIKTKKSIVKVLKVYEDSSVISISISEGRNHQIRKMFSILGYNIISLKRIRIGAILLGNLKVGDFRNLSREEVSSFE